MAEVCRTWRRRRTGRRAHPVPPPYVEEKWQSAGTPRLMPTARWLKQCAPEWDGPYGERYFLPRREYQVSKCDNTAHKKKSYQGPGLSHCTPQQYHKR
jgi:hypothetical protein